MNTTQAKRIAGIAFDARGEAGRQKALADIKRQLVDARRNGDETRAAELSAAKAVFTKQRKNRCEDCGVTINPSATHCAQHQRKRAPKALPLPEGFTPAPRPQGKRKNARVDVVSSEANLGFYTAPVQKVVKAWLAKQTRIKWIQETFEDVAMAVFYKEHKAEIRVAHYGLWPMAWQLGEAISRVMDDKNSLDFWLLTRDTLCTNGEYRSVPDIAETIVSRGGKKFNHAAIRGGLSRLRLVTPKDIAADFKRSRRGVTK